MAPLSSRGRSIRVFGSWARGEQTESSDLDLLVDLEAGRSLLDLTAIKQDLEDLLHCAVDVVTERSLSPSLRKRVLSEAIPKQLDARTGDEITPRRTVRRARLTAKLAGLLDGDSAVDFGPPDGTPVPELTEVAR